MLKRYSIWDKVSPVITPIYEILSAEEWMERYPVARLDNITVVGSAGEVNGGFFGTLGQMRSMYEGMGCDFSNATTNEKILEAIEAFEDARNAEASDYVSNEERIAAALEAQNMMAMDDIE